MLSKIRCQNNKILHPGDLTVCNIYRQSQNSTDFHVVLRCLIFLFNVFLLNFVLALLITLKVYLPLYPRIRNRHEFPLAPKGVLAPGRPAARPPIDTGTCVCARVFKHLPLPLEVISEVSEP